MSIFQNCIFTNPAGHWNIPRGVLLRILGGGVPPDSLIKSWAYFRPKNVVFRIRFQTWRRSQNATYVFTKAEIMSSSLRLERQQEDIEFVYCPFFLIHLDWNDEYIHTLLWFPRKLYPFQTKMGKVYTVFQTKSVHKPYRPWGGTYLYGLYKRVLSPGRYLAQVTSIYRSIQKSSEGTRDALYFSFTCVQAQLYEFH